ISAATIGNVAKVSSEDRARFLVQSGDRQFNKDLGAVGAEGRYLKPFSENRPVAAVEVMPETLAMPISERRRNNQGGQFSADNLFPIVTEDPLRRFVEFDHPAFRVHRDNAVQSGVEERPIKAGVSRFRYGKGGDRIVEFHS